MIDLLAVQEKALEFAYEEWRAGTSEKDQSDGGRLAAIFRDSGFSANGVVHQASGKVCDWCGMFVGAMKFRAGLAKRLRTAWLHTWNVEDHFRYGSPAARNPDRFMAEVFVAGLWKRVTDWHEAEGARRLWMGERQVRSGDAHALDIRPGDTVVIDYQGPADKVDDERGDLADHITMAAEFRDGVLSVVNGNASGFAPDMKTRIGDAACVTLHDLNDPVARRRIYGIGRDSPLDYEPAVVYRSLAESRRAGGR